MNFSLNPWKIPRKLWNTMADSDYMRELRMERQHFTREELDHYKEAFSLYDTHDKGYITTKELGALIRSLGQNPTESDLAEMINEVDSDKNGLLEFEEFIRIMAKRMTWESMAFEISEAFRVFDRDRNGFISADELRHQVTTVGDKLTQDEVTDLLRVADQNGDGLIDYKEFVRMMLNLGVGYDIDDKSCDSKVWSCYNNSVTVNTSEHNSYTNNSGPVSSVCDIDT
ncbi:uncharacterized protein LOC134819142 isoform X2 [Bolinopsis microptera]|uniref:uncharacterized protein LOC134819142 isoform X2 n=1 Tax=Bolinopsis microptera TaxID=2820187 RepID=UPI00307A07AD